MITKFYELRNKYPENIMTDKRNKPLVAKRIDFRIRKAARSDHDVRVFKMTM